jgi:hypothetical protein
MKFFLKIIDEYLSETQKRVKMLGECYHAIQKLQIEHGVIEKLPEGGDPPIIW